MPFVVHYKNGETKTFPDCENFAAFPNKLDITCLEFTRENIKWTLKGSKTRELKFIMHKAGYCGPREGRLVNMPFVEVEFGLLDADGNLTMLCVNLFDKSSYVYTTTVKSLGLNLKEYGYD